MTLVKRLSNNNLLAISIGLAYLWFGLLKFFPGLSPAEELAKNTIDALTFGLIPTNISIILLAIWETLVGTLLVLNFQRRFAIRLALVHLAFTFTPLFLFPEVAFSEPPFYFTLEGQYIFKNLILVAALFYLYRLPLSPLPAKMK